MEGKFDQLNTKLELLESRITKNLKIEIKAIVEESIRDLLDDSISEHDKKILTHINESVLNNTQQMTEKLEAMFLQSDQLVEKFSKVTEELDGLRLKNCNLATDLCTVKASQEFINAEFEIQKDYIVKLDQVVRNLSAKNEYLLSMFNSLKHRFDHDFEDLAQYVRRENIEFHGISFREGENTDNIVVEIGKKLGITVERLDISVSHRLPRRDSSKTGPIIVRFTNRNKKNEFIAKKFDASQIKDFGITGWKYERYIHKVKKI
uniref:uncharacterized protein LOC120325476 n=1 Tax=Styela clava TaxID=7725 RepID=UPI0019399A35|nr:uncharacterized protein LOC120325476 [Styela clava]XP_039272141.1 uncharacterized protein LOC120346464 [Styela clava]